MVLGVLGRSSGPNKGTDCKTEWYCGHQCHLSAGWALYPLCCPDCPWASRGFLVRTYADAVRGGVRQCFPSAAISEPLGIAVPTSEYPQGASRQPFLNSRAELWATQCPHHYQQSVWVTVSPSPSTECLGHTVSPLPSTECLGHSFPISTSRVSEGQGYWSSTGFPADT